MNKCINIFFLIIFTFSCEKYDQYKEQLEDPQSTNNSSALLSNISISNSLIIGSFNPKVFEYDFVSPSFINSINIQVEAQSTEALVFINEDETKNIDNFEIEDGLNIIEILVINKNNKETYKVSIQKNEDITLSQYIKESPNPIEQNNFGLDISVWDNKLFLASRYENKIYIYKKSDLSLELIQVVESPITDINYDFGTAISSYNNKFVTSATRNTGGQFANGYLYIYEENSQGIYEISNQISIAGTFINFAGSEFDNDGLKMTDNIVVVSEPSLYGSSKAYIIEKNINGVWSIVKTISSTENRLGASIGISEDEKTIVLSQPTIMMDGKILIYQKIDQDWIKTDEFTPDDGGKNMGSSVTINNNTIATSIICGANYTNIYSKIDGAWIKTHKINEGGDSLYLKDNLLLIGRSYLNNVQLYNFDGTSWYKTNEISAPNPDSCDKFGINALYFDNTIYISSPQEDSDGLDQENNNLTNSGAIFIYQ